MNKYIVMPKPSAIKITYLKQDNTKKNYKKVVPIEIQRDKFSAYVFGEGVRSFRFDRIVSLSQIKL